MALIAGATTLPVVLKYSDLPDTGPFDGYRCIVASLGCVAQWDETNAVWDTSVRVYT